MSKKKLLLNKIADHSKKMAELQKQIKEMETTELLKVGECVLKIYRSGIWDGEQLKNLVSEITGESFKGSAVLSDAAIDNSKLNSEQG